MLPDSVGLREIGFSGAISVTVRKLVGRSNDSSSARATGKLCGLSTDARMRWFQPHVRSTSAGMAQACRSSVTEIAGRRITVIIANAMI